MPFLNRIGSGSTSKFGFRMGFGPGASTAVTASLPSTYGNTTALVSWTAPVILGSPAFHDYEIQYSSDSGSTWTTFVDGTSTTTSATVTGLTNGTSYTFRVSATNASGTSSYSTVTSAVIPNTCSIGGACAVSNIGPGGGVVFYIGATATNAVDGISSGGTILEYGTTTTKIWCSVTRNADGTWHVVPGADGTAIGTGAQNTKDIEADCTQANTAADYAANLTEGGKSDWFLPSLNELNELCKYARTQTTGNTATDCAATGSLRTSFSAVEYYSSSEYFCCGLASGNAWFQNFGNGHLWRDNGGGKAGTDSVRAVRAFGPTGSRA